MHGCIPVNVKFPHPVHIDVLNRMGAASHSV